MMIGGPARAPLPEAQTGISNHGWGRRTEPKTNIHANGAGKLAGGPGPHPSGDPADASATHGASKKTIARKRRGRS
jgi:hypothetical protein